MEKNYNISRYLKQRSVDQAESKALVLVHPDGREKKGLSFKELEDKVRQCAAGLRSQGVQKGTRVLLMVRPGEELIVIAFALVRLGALPILIDPGMGLKSALKCIERSEPEVLIGIPIAHWVSKLFRKAFRSVQIKICVGSSWFKHGLSIEKCYIDQEIDIEFCKAEEVSAILFTSGSTGPPKGVMVTHGQFEYQIRLLEEGFGIEKNEVDLTLLPIFALFNPAMGMTTVVPLMNPSKPAQVNPEHIVATLERQKVTESFGSPVLWRKITQYCFQNGKRLPSLKRIVMAGAPVPPRLIEQCMSLMDNGRVLTPYGATEALPITMIEGQEILDHTRFETEGGAGNCVGRPVPDVEIQIIPIIEGRVKSIDQTRFLEPGEIGEIIVRGPVVSKGYDRLPEATLGSRISDEQGDWYRMGDAGYIDQEARLWFCGRLTHRVQTDDGIYYPVCCEGILNTHEKVFRSALVGIDEQNSRALGMVVEMIPEEKGRASQYLQEWEDLLMKAERPFQVKRFYEHDSFPVDVRHNAKIHRLELAAWANQRRPLRA